MVTGIFCAAADRTTIEQHRTLMTSSEKALMMAIADREFARKELCDLIWSERIKWPSFRFFAAFGGLRLRTLATIEQDGHSVGRAQLENQPLRLRNER